MINTKPNLQFFKILCLDSFLPFEALCKEELDSVQVAPTREVDDEVHGTTEDKAEVVEAGGAENPRVGQETIWAPGQKIN